MSVKGYLDSTELIKSIKRRGMVPTSQNTFQDTDFLALANEEMDIGVVPDILTTHEDYFLTSEEVLLTSSPDGIYDIPYRAIGNKLRDLAFKDTSGNIYEMSRIPVDNISDYQASWIETRVHKYYVKSNQIYLLPNLTYNMGGSLIFFFYLRPNHLVPVNEVGVIKSITPVVGGTEIVLNNWPSNFDLATSTVFDFIQVQTPFKSLDYDVSVISKNSGTKVLKFATADIPNKMEIGDHVALKGETCIPQLPQELHPVIAQRAAMRCLEAFKDTEGMAIAEKKLTEMEKNTDELINNRVEGSPLKIINRNSFIRIGRRRRRNY